MAKKYSKFVDQDHEVKTFRWPYWLLPLLFLSLLLVLGLFIFITIHSTDRFGCFFHCEQKIDDGGLVPPDEVDPSEHRRGHENFTENTSNSSSQAKHGKQTKNQVQIRVYGTIIFPKGRIPDSIPTNSHLKVELQDTSWQDVSATDIASTEVDLSLYKKGSPLKFEIKCPMPNDIPPEYSLDAVLNMGWKPTDSDWIRKGDYMVDTMHRVEIKKDEKNYKNDIQLVYYS